MYIYIYICVCLWEKLNVAIESKEYNSLNNMHIFSLFLIKI